MSLQLLGGIAKGCVLKFPKNSPGKQSPVRPTAVRLRRRVFDFQQNWQGRIVFDLCAGSGALGLEAWSRGAARVTLVDFSRQVLSHLQANVKTLETRFPDESAQRPLLVERGRLPRYLAKLENLYLSLSADEQRQAVLFFDPPYDQNQLYERVGIQLFEKRWFCGQFYLESGRQFDREAWNERFGPPARLFSEDDRSMALFLFKSNSIKLNT